MGANDHPTTVPTNHEQTTADRVRALVDALDEESSAITPHQKEHAFVPTVAFD